MKPDTISEIRDGKYTHCLAQECTNNCCQTKVGHTASLMSVFSDVDIDWNTPSVVNGQELPYSYKTPVIPYAATLTHEEIKKLSLIKGNTPGTPWKLSTKFSISHVSPLHKRVGVTMTHYISCCLAESGCTLGENKPSICSLYPFTVFSEYPVDTRCPQNIAIASDEENVIQMLLYRKNVMKRDNGTYFRGLCTWLTEQGVNCNWSFLREEQAIKKLGIE